MKEVWEIENIPAGDHDAPLSTPFIAVHKHEPVTRLAI